ncbi:glycosyltransferase family 4 protein [Peribacillus castrilensis]|uniref:glycosyltransferase family 4 protein n=1 Tax=Peribacillus castrilensis TaxID=2897690 RepID=UPI003D286B9D
MKIAFVTRSMWAGGAERVISELVKYMATKDIECSIITIDNEQILYEIPEGVEVHAIGELSKTPHLDKFQRYRKLRSIVKKLRPDLVLALPEDIGIYVIPALIGTKIPVVVSERNNPWVMPWKKETRLLRKLLYPLATGFIFQTEEAKSYFPHFIRKKGKVLPNPLDLNRIPIQWNGVRRKEVIGAGRLDKQKNFPLLIRSFAKFHKNYPDYVLTIYGEGILREELESLAASLLPVGSYSFPGRTSELLERINGGAIFVLSSDFEGMPNVVIETMAMGMPVISTNCPSGGSSELIQNGENGILVPVGDIDSLTIAMAEIAGSDDFANKLGRNAQEIKKRLDSDIVAEKWRNYLESHISGK